MITKHKNIYDHGDKKQKPMKSIQYFHNFWDDVLLFFIFLFYDLFIFFYQISSLLSDFLSSLNDFFFFCLNLLFHLYRFWQDFFKQLHLSHIREYPYRLNIILTWSKWSFTIVNMIAYHGQHNCLNLKSFFHRLKRITQSCLYDLNDHPKNYTIVNMIV